MYIRNQDAKFKMNNLSYYIISSKIKNCKL